MPSTLTAFTQTKGDNNRPVMYREGASQTYVFGDFVKDTSGLVVLAAAANTNFDSSGDPLAGTVRRAGRNGANPSVNSSGAPVWDVPVTSPDDDTLFYLPLWSSVAANTYLNVVNQGLTCVLRNVGGIWVANLDTTANPVLRLHDIPPHRNTTTEPYLPCWWKVIQTVRAGG